ncbi:MAG: DUF748 domain-containing protein [Candidatus Fibromonas sp.]|nr:DUF748 domain-containing protein [Candidatus Fibromonas sp.]
MGILFRNRYFRIASIAMLVVSALVVIYALLAIYVLPGIVKSRLERKVAELVGGEAHIGVVKIRPFALALTVRDFSVSNKTLKFTWDSLYINAQLRSIHKRSIYLDELRIHESHIMLALDEKRLESITEAFFARVNEPLYIERFIIQNSSLEILDNRTGKENRFAIKPISFSLEKFSTRYSPEQGNNYNLQFTGLNGGSFRWKGNLQWMPFLSEGEMEIRGLDIIQFRDFYRKYLPFELQSGILDLQTGYRLAEEPEFGFELKDAKAALNKPFLLADSSRLAMQASSIQFGTLQLSTFNRAISTDNIVLDSLRASYYLLNAPKQPDPELLGFLRHNDEQKWQVQIDTIQAKKARFEFTDSVITPAVVYDMNIEQLLLTDIANRAGNPVKVHLLSSLNNSGKLNLQGAAYMFPLQASGTLNIENFSLMDLQSYLSRATWLTLRQGQASVALDMRWNPATDSLLFAGNANIDSLRLLGKNNNELISIQQMDAKDFEIMFAPDSRFQIGKANVQSPVAYLTRLSDSTANFSQIMKQKTGTPFKINQINFSRGTVYFADRNPATPFSYRMTAVQGSMRNSNLSIQGKMGGYAPFSVKGSYNFSKKYPYINFTAEAANQDLIAFSPYSGWYAGYRISKGQAALHVDYKIQNNKVNGKNHIVVQHLTFGEKVDSPEATDMPVRLGVALLSDKDGVMDLDIAIEGDLSDPEFSVGSLIWKIIKNLLGKAISAPFKSLMSLVGSNSDPENITFAPGSEHLDKAQTDALRNLSSALMQRPQLQVDVRGNADSTIDGNALKETLLLRALRASSAASAKRPPLRDTLFAYYRRVEKKDWRSALQSEEASEEALAKASEHVWNELLANQKLPDNALSGLASGRAHNIKLELININAALGERIFVVDEGTLSKPVANLKIREY